MSAKQIEKEVNRQAVLFEESCKRGQTVTAAKFETFARERFKDYAERKLKRNTLCRYHRMEKRIYSAFGHIRIDRISTLDIQRFVSLLIKRFRIVSDKHHNRRKRFSLRFNLICGICSFELNS
jgi:hypothetical protein